MPIYSRPPIVEAVIEAQFSDAPLSKRDMERFVKRIERKYPTSQLMLDYDIGFQVSNGIAKTAEPKLRREWFRCVGHDVADILNIRPTSLVTARTAPYETWDILFASFEKDLQLLRKLAGFKRITRIGTRYINRIDVPSPQSAPIDPRQYLNIYPWLPFQEYPELTTNLSTIQYRNGDGTNVIVRAGLADPALINHASLLLDIDVFSFEDLPMKIDSILDMYDRLRQMKNRLFEDLITEKGRALFQ